jgi:hypothetical protein
MTYTSSNDQYHVQILILTLIYDFLKMYITFSRPLTKMSSHPDMLL